MLKSDGSVDTSGTSIGSWIASASYTGNSETSLLSTIEVYIGDSDTTDDDEDVDMVCVRVAEVEEELELPDRLVGVATSDSDDSDGGSVGIGVKSSEDDRAEVEEIGEIDSRFVREFPMEDAESLGQRIDDSKDISLSS